MNDRERYSRSLAVHQSGWLCAGLVAATGLYCFSSPNSMLGAVGVPAGGSRENQTGHQYADSADSERVERALFEADPEAPQASGIQRIAVWPLKKKPAATTTKTTRPKLLPWTSDVRDPFAEADEAAQKKILAEQPQSHSQIAGETGFAKSTSNRRRLLDFQAKSTGTKVADDEPASNPEVTGKVKVQGDTESTAEFDVDSPVAAATEPGVEGDAEASLRAMFEENSAADESAGRATVRTASKTPAREKEESATTAQGNSAATREIRQVSEADAGQDPTLEPASSNTPLPVEALLYRAQMGQERQAKVTSQPLKLAAEQVEAPASDEASSTAESDLPQLAEPQETPSDAESEPQTIESSPESQSPDTEQPARAKVDQVPMTSKSASLSMKVVPRKRAPARIPDSQPVETHQAESTPRPVAEPVESVEPVIRPAPKTDLPPEQVLANRPIELPAPEGWSAAVKLNARRAARMAELTARKPSDTVWPDGGRSAAKSRSAEEADEQPLHGEAEQQSYRAGSSRLPVALDKIEDESGVRVLAADDSGLEHIRDAHHITEPTSAEQEPAMIGEASAEPIVVAEYAAHGQSVWWIRVFTVIGVLFGLYGMWCCRLRSTDGE